MPTLKKKACLALKHSYLMLFKDQYLPISIYKLYCIAYGILIQTRSKIMLSKLAKVTVTLYIAKATR